MILVLIIAAIFIVVWAVIVIKFIPIRTLPPQVNSTRLPTPVQVTTITNDPIIVSINKTPIPSNSQWIDIHPEANPEYLANPSIGWQFDSGDTQGSSVLPETVSYVRKEISWKKLNPEEGIYNWQLLDMYIKSAKQNGKDISFRIYTMIGETFGGPEVPQWVLEKGAVILSVGEPDYSNCIYQQEWGEFVEAMIQRFDGNPDIAFFDISGYGNFNEWSWREQTQWDDSWDQDYRTGNTTSSSIKSIDGQARRRLADMFIGGSYSSHLCLNNSNEIQTVSYNYQGFQKTQLVMPYAGIKQSTEYVFSRKPDVGFRYDCLGRDTTSIIDEFSNEISQIWHHAPVVFEFCLPDQTNVSNAAILLNASHGSLVHNNGFPYDKQSLKNLIKGIGYRYFLKEIGYNSDIQSDNSIHLEMIWQNIGNAPYYPKMGHSFQMHFFLLDELNNTVFDYPIITDIASWMPAEKTEDIPPEYPVSVSIPIPTTLSPGSYTPYISIIDQKTNTPINLAMKGDDTGRYILANIQITKQ